MAAHKVLHEMFKAPHLMSDPGASKTIYVDRQLAAVPIVTAAAEARTLAQATKAGLICVIMLDTDGGDLTLTVTGGYDAAGNTSLTFADAGDWVKFVSVKVGSSYYWRAEASEGVSRSETIGTLTIENPIVSSYGAGTKNGATVAATETGDGIVHKTVLTLTNHSTTMADEAGVIAYGSSKIYDFPAGAILVLGAVVDLTVTKSGAGINADFDGDCALGTTAAGNNNALATTEANILASFSTNQAVNGVAAVEGQGATVIATSLNGTATASDMYLNYLVDDDDHNIGTTAAALLSSGTITLHWINLGDIS